MRPFEPRDLEELNQWRATEEKFPLALSELSPYGVTEPGIAIGFITRTDGPVFIIDGFATNPKASRRKRVNAYIEIMKMLVQIGKALGHTHLLAFTDSELVARTAQKRLGVTYKSNFIGHKAL